MGFRDSIQELRELGTKRSLYRVLREVRQRSGLHALDAVAERRRAARFRGDLTATPSAAVLVARWFAHPAAMRARFGERIGSATRDDLRERTALAREGTIVAFSRWRAEYGEPVDWYRDPQTGRRWQPDVHSAVALRAPVGDVKLVWEIGRFPHAFALARAATFCPELEAEAAAIFERHLLEFVASTPYPRGVHWASGQEVALRLLAWSFALSVFSRLRPIDPRVAHTFHAAAGLMGAHIAAELHYAEHAVYNNHLIVEAAGLELAARLRPDLEGAREWRLRADRILREQAAAQIYEDGAYIQHSHTYHRLALEAYLAVASIRGSEGEPIPGWLRDAMRRSFDFLHAQQNARDGRLPNFGNNDGADGLPLTACDYTDFRPLLQLASVVGHGTRAFDEGPWDEALGWLFPSAADAPLKARVQQSVSFPASGYHVLRPTGSGGDFAVVRCGNLRERFGQIDMMHVDWWRGGRNVLIDGGSYSYNGPREWLNHFFRTGVHNTVSVDGADQMLHYRPFKALYWTRAAAKRFVSSVRGALFDGEHYGYARLVDACVHRRVVHLSTHHDLIVVDRVLGGGTHEVRLHWLCADGRYELDHERTRLLLGTGDARVQVRVYDERGPAELDVARALENPPRGWHSRYYGERLPAVSVAVSRRGPLPRTLITVASDDAVELTRHDAGWTVRCGVRTYDVQCNADGDVGSIEEAPS